MSRITHDAQVIIKRNEFLMTAFEGQSLKEWAEKKIFNLETNSNYWRKEFELGNKTEEEARLIVDQIGDEIQILQSTIEKYGSKIK